MMLRRAVCGSALATGPRLRFADSTGAPLQQARSAVRGSSPPPGMLAVLRQNAHFVLADERRSMKKEMLVNALQPEESRIAIIEDGVLEELYIERNSQENYVGNIYKGRVVNLEPSIQAAFVDFGVGRN
jgi:hypothetical protein